MPDVEETSGLSFVDEWKGMWEPDLEAIAYSGATCDPTRVDPKVLQWSRENCAHEPKFIKVINKSASQYGWLGPSLGSTSKSHSQFRLGVPRPFVREHYKQLGRVVTLEDGISHKKWKVSFAAAKKNSFWMQGWKRMAEDNGLEPGDVVIFVLIGHSHFLFHVFDEGGNYPPTTNRKDVEHVNRPRVVITKAEPGSSKSEYIHRESSYQEHDGLIDLNDSDEDEIIIKRKPKLRRLFDPDVVIVKREPGRPEGHVDDQPPVFGFRSSPDSVTDCECSASVRRHRQSPAPNLMIDDSSQISVKLNADTQLAAKSGVTTARKGCEGGCLVNRKLNFESPNDLESQGEEEPSLTYNATIMGQSEPRPAISHELPIDPLNYFVVSKRRVTTPTEWKRAKDAAKPYAATLTGCVGFVRVMKETEVYTDFHLRLPDNFVLESGLIPTERTRLRLVDCDNSGSSSTTSSSWEMYTMVNSRNEVSFYHKHWGLFSLEHFLEEGDVCVFHITDKDTFTICVRIFRVVQLRQKQQLVLGRPVRRTVQNHYDLRPKPSLQP